MIPMFRVQSSRNAKVVKDFHDCDHRLRHGQFAQRADRAGTRRLQRRGDPRRERDRCGSRCRPAGGRRLQRLLSESEEFGRKKGMDRFAGKVVGFHALEDLKVPHMGWNRIEKKKESPFLEGIASGDYVYFVHSFYVVPDESSIVATKTDYGNSFVSSIATDR